MCQKDPGLAYKTSLSMLCLLRYTTKLQKVAENAYTPSIPEIDRKFTPPKHNTWNSK